MRKLKIYPILPNLFNVLQFNNKIGKIRLILIINQINIKFTNRLITFDTFRYFEQSEIINTDVNILFSMYYINIRILFPIRKFKKL